MAFKFNTHGLPVHVKNGDIFLILGSIDANCKREHTVAIKLDPENDYQADAVTIVQYDIANLVTDIEDPSIGVLPIFDQAEVNLHWVLSLMASLVSMDKPKADDDEHSLRGYVEYALWLLTKVGAIKREELHSMLVDFYMEGESPNGIVLAPTEDFGARLNGAKSFDDVEALTHEYLAMLAPGYYRYSKLL